MYSGLTKSNYSPKFIWMTDDQKIQDLGCSVGLSSGLIVGGLVLGLVGHLVLAGTGTGVGTVTGSGVEGFIDVDLTVVGLSEGFRLFGYTVVDFLRQVVEGFEDKEQICH